MRVILGGFNVDTRTIRELAPGSRPDITPEIISASYARISRDPRDVRRLREEARREVERARRSNTSIVFGLGHASVAEHAVFNFDIMDVSRLAVEEVERFRLASFTEKSQRYIRLGADFVRPPEIYASGFGRRFEGLVDSLARTYETLGRRIIAAGGSEAAAKEDARYLMPLATSAQFGMTVNARELEYMISRLAAHPLGELRELARRLASVSRRIAPSLIRYPEPTPYAAAVPAVRTRIAERAHPAAQADGVDVKLIDATGDPDLRLAASLIFSSAGATFAEALRSAKRLGARGRAELIAWTLEHMEPYQAVWREFEYVQFLFEVTVSAACYAQLKRHRMTTQVVQSYSPRLGLTVPDSVRDAAQVGVMRAAAAEARRLYRALLPRIGPAAEYALINANRRRVLIQINLRELYHFSRLRSDRHSQWEIRRVSDAMCAAALRAAPCGAALLCGKDEYQRRKERPGKT